ncbi:MAG: mobility-associated LCxxNW protein [Lachnospiraceae bacterium]|nr:mobility-associated LCxxNW protein [Lachnospiraceae bacterium]
MSYAGTNTRSHAYCQQWQASSCPETLVGACAHSSASADGQQYGYFADIRCQSSALLEVDECNELCHGNWIEIERKSKYIQLLKDLLSENNISFPEEYEI